MERADAQPGPALPLARAHTRILAALVLLGLAALVAAAIYVGGGSSDLALVPIAVGSVVLLAIATVGILAGMLPRPSIGGAGEVCLFALVLLALWSGASIAWSIAPDLSWGATNRALLYLALLCLGVIVGSAIRRAPSLVAASLGALVAAALVWALAAKVFPGLNEDGGRIARLRLPVGYLERTRDPLRPRASRRIVARSGAPPSARGTRRRRPLPVRARCRAAPHLLARRHPRGRHRARRLPRSRQAAGWRAWSPW